MDIPELASAAEEYSLPGLLRTILGHRDQDVVNETTQLASSLAHAIGDPSYSDVRFIPNDGRPISAYRFILESRSSYFSAMFESGMKESAAGKWKQYSSTTTHIIYIYAQYTYHMHYLWQ